MKVFFDTSVLVAAALKQHPHHHRSLAAIAETDRQNACCGAHSQAELYAVLTRLPGKDRVGGDRALLVLDGIEQKMEVVSLTAREYRAAINESAAAGVLGGRLYDALLAECALKARATRILTWNVAHFRSLRPEVAAKVQTP
jgi:predicted nucleic acid-binding protein